MTPVFSTRTRKAKTLEEKLESEVARRDNDPRWAKVRSSTLVRWEGHYVTWAELAGNERQECYFDSDGTLVGGFPFGPED